MRKLLVASMTLIFLTASSLLADDRSHQKAIEDFLIVMNMESLMSQTIQQLVNVQIQRNQKLAPFKRTMLTFFTKYLGWAIVKDEVISIWKNTFIETEIRELTAFYRTPTGQKALKVMPALTAKGAQIGQQRVQQHLSELIRMVEE